MKYIIQYEDSKFYTTIEEKTSKIFGKHTPDVMHMFNKIIDKFPEAQICKVAFIEADDTILIYLRNRREFLMEAITEYFDYNNMVRSND